MRIAHITDVYLPRVGGIERQVHELALRQAAAGHDVHVITTTGGAADHDGPVRVHRLAGAHARLPHAVVFDPRVRRTLHAVLTEVAPDVAHVHASVASPLGFVAGLATSGRRPRPTVVTVHSMWAHLTLPYRGAAALTGFPRRPVLWTAVSRAAADQVERALGGTTEVGVLPNGIDPCDWTTASRPPSSPNDVHVVAVLRLAARKRPLALLDVVRRAREQLPPEISLRVSVVGDGRLRPAATRYLTAHQMSWVQLLGARQREEVHQLLEEADLFLATARLESFGIAALEARCAGVPVVALEATGVSDFVEHGREGLLADSDDGLVAAVVQLAGSVTARSEMADHSRRHPPSVSWRRSLELTEQAYAQAALLTRPAPRRPAPTRANSR